MPADPRSTSPDAVALAGAADVVALVRHVVAGRGRQDLLAELDDAARTLGRPTARVLVAGGRTSGKSSLVNALVGAPVVPTGQPTVAPVELLGGPTYDIDVRTDTAPAGVVGITVADGLRLASAAYNPENTWRVRSVRVTVPSPALAGGLELVDLPGLVTTWSPATALMLDAAARAVSVLWVADGRATLTAAELDVLRLLALRCRDLVVVVTGTDQYPTAPAVARENERLLDLRGIDARVLAVAAVPYWGAAGGVPPGPDPGVRAVATHLDGLVNEATRRQITAALGAAFAVVDRLRFRLGAEHDLLDPPLRGLATADPRSTLDRAATAVDHLDGPEAGWLQALRAGRAHLDADLRAERERLRTDRYAELAAARHAGSSELATASRHLADAVVHFDRVRTLALRSWSREVLGGFAREFDEVVALLDPDRSGRLSPTLNRPALHPGRWFDEVDATPAGWGVSGPPQAGRDPTAWLVNAEVLLGNDADQVRSLADALESVCREAARRLQRDLLELRAAASVRGDLTAAAVSRRCEELEADLWALRGIERPTGP